MVIGEENKAGEVEAGNGNDGINFADFAQAKEESHSEDEKSSRRRRDAPAAQDQQASEEQFTDVQGVS